MQPLQIIHGSTRNPGHAVKNVNNPDTRGEGDKKGMHLGRDVCPSTLKTVLISERILACPVLIFGVNVGHLGNPEVITAVTCEASPEVGDKNTKSNHPP